MDGECFYKNCAIRNRGCEETCLRFGQMRYLMESAKLPKALAKPIKLVPDECDVACFEKLDAIKRNARSFVERGGNLFICGNVTGNGKTSWAVKIMQSYFNQIWQNNNHEPHGLFLSVPHLLNLQSRGFGDSVAMAELTSVYDMACGVDLLIMDDLACTEMTKAQQNLVQGILDARLNNALATIYTGNLNGMPLQAAVGQRIYSRVETNSEVVFLQGRDMRGTTANFE